MSTSGTPLEGRPSLPTPLLSRIASARLSAYEATPRHKDCIKVQSNLITFTGAGIIHTLPRTIRYECPEEYNQDEVPKESETSSQVTVEKEKSSDSIEEDLKDNEDDYNVHLDMSVLKTRRQLGPVCKYFTNVQDFAYYLVDDIIDEAQDILSNRWRPSVQS
ncbi:unnamed protein product [Callosobruchus maculatus]|uniref:Uncharacterized protein n=1 Tax=Callosobruchus maculatus TaxID=64391 RepID=A0A653DCD4_CALMS|nr:unnamed protein product [Callosobruchus maculatus]